MSLLRRILNNPVTRLLLAALVIVTLAAQFAALNPLAPMRSEAAPARSDTVPAVEGWLKDRASGEAVAGATISVNDVALATSDNSGYFSLSASDLGRAGPASAQAEQPLNVQVSAPGHARWSIEQAIYYPGDTLRLYPHLDPAGKPDTTTRAALALNGSERPAKGRGTMSARTAAGALAGGGPRLNTAALSANAQANAQVMGLTPPATIRVYRTATQVVEVVPFKDYVKHVLPNEWVPTWNAASLRAGAMAVKTYAWYWIAQGGKQTSLQADVKDNTEDQVYDPNVSYASTDAAVDATFQYVMTRGGSLFQSQYCAGTYDPDPSGDCPWGGPYMTQWGSDYYGDQGKTWGWILEFYYPDLTVTPDPPGGGYDGPPGGAESLPTKVPPTPAPNNPPAPPSGGQGSFSVGQGAANAQPYIEAYNRNGGQSALGKPTGPVRWWLTYVSENNVQAQPFSGPDGRGNTWIVFDVLKSTSIGVQNAYVLSGDIATAYGTHNPPGPEWIGAPTSDPYSARGETGGVASQGFTRGTLAVTGGGVQYAPWPSNFQGWKAEYFVGHQAIAGKTAPTLDLPGQPALVQDVPSPGFSWTQDSGTPASLGAGTRDWSVQLTRDYQADGGTYDFTLSADSGVRLWVDGVLAVNGWQWTATQQAQYSADLAPGSHRIRLQYYSPTQAAQLAFDVEKRGAAKPAPAATAPPRTAPPQQLPSQARASDTGAQLRVRVQWLGRGSAPNAAWAQPLTLQLTVPGTNAIVGTYKGSTDQNGVAFFRGLPSGVYHVHVKGLHSLQSARANVTLGPQSTPDLDLKVQVEGDINGDNCVNVDDLTLVQSLFGTNRGTPGFNPAADLNNDGQVSLEDISLLRSGFDMCGDLSADAQFSVLSSDGAPALSQQLSPWLAPERQQHGLGMFITLSTSGAHVGQVVDAQIVANTGSQAIDGGAFVLHYDPRVLAPLDPDGEQAVGATPGIALPSVMGNWLDAKGGAIGYAGGMLQGEAPHGMVVLAKVRFKVLSMPAGGTTALTFQPTPSSLMQITNGGVNLLGKATDATLLVAP